MALPEKLPLDQLERLAKLPLEEVVWEDHYSTEDWTHVDDDELTQSIFVTSVGYVLKETKTKLVLVANKSDNAQIFGTITILKKTIKKRTRIRD